MLLLARLSLRKGQLLHLYIANQPILDLKFLVAEAQSTNLILILQVDKLQHVD